MIRHKLAFALQLVDDFTGKRIERTACSFQVDGRLVPAIYKEEGFYLFMEPMEGSCRVDITAQDYFPGTVQIDKEKLDSRYPVVEARLYHRPGGQFPYRCSLCCGKTEPPEPGKPFMLCGVSQADSGYSLKAIKEDGGQTIIELTGYHKEKLTGKVFGLGSGKDFEFFVISEKRGVNEYQISGSLKRKHQKGDKLFRVYRTCADGEGNYVMPVAEGSEEQITITVLPEA